MVFKVPSPCYDGDFTTSSQTYFWVNFPGKSPQEFTLAGNKFALRNDLPNTQLSMHLWAA